MEKHLELLGHKAEDSITGATGVVDSICFDLYGCVQASLNQGLDKDGKKKDCYWYDIKRLNKTSQKPVMAVPDFNLPEIGPADKPVR